MTQRQSRIGIITGVTAACAVFTLAAASVTAGDLQIQAAGLDVSLSTHTENGFVVKIDGAECPGAGCPAFALNWSLPNRRG